ncbi:GNAT family N-acetyltransferase [Streptomyces sp. NBC_01363]|uniref:GNAT family N-acetyltransferase n=1 Tax=Streptomyces sp. NBC_01363 TaxID=2903840 RepID=UPI00224F250B|nr:GNAT family protein [Streptomyces sp. NBC_01363]MCX4731953.1 GNAT family N-acetyltransferase [Streptomyces sp. NBC_01363]
MSGTAGAAATDPTRCACWWHLFGAFGLHRIELDTWSGNERAVRAFVKAGFREEGRRRGAVLVAGRRYDTVLFGTVREEWPGGAG